MVNVTTYGADPLGVMDSTAAFQSAINTGDSVYAPAGTYLIGGTLALSGQKLYGDGIDVTTLKKNSAAQSFITIAPTGPHTEICDLSFDNAVTPTSGSTIYINSGNVTVRDIHILKSFIGIECDAVAGVFLNKIWSENCYSVGLWVHNSNDVYMSQFILNAIGTNAIGVKLSDKAEAVVLESGDVIGGSNGLWTGASSNTIGNRPAYNRFSNVYFDSSTSGVWLDRTVMNKFSNCWFSNRPGNGFFVGNCNDTSFSNCEFANSGQYGCLVDVLAKRTRFDNCSFVGNSVNSNNTYHGLAFAPGTTDFTVQNCTATNGMVGGQQGWGIIVNSGSSNRYIIAHNLVSGNGVGGVSDAGSGPSKAVGNNF